MASKMGRPWRFTTGPMGHHVTAQERRFGGAVHLYWYDRKIRGRRKKSRGFFLRDAEGRLIEAQVRRARQEAIELATRLMQGDAPQGDVTLEELIALFRREVVSGHSPKHRLETDRHLDLWRNFLGSSFVVSHLGMREWNAFIRERRAGSIDARGHRVPDALLQRPVRDRVVAKSLLVLRQLCGFGTRYRLQGGGFLLKADPTAGLPVPSEENPMRPVADTDRFRRLLEVADRVRMFDLENRRVRSYLRELLILAHETGRRIGAILSLRWSDWNPGTKPFGALRWRAEHDKIGREWVTPVTPAARRVLEDLRMVSLSLGEAFVFADPRDPKRSVTRHAATGWLRMAEDYAGLDHLQGGAWHMFRRAWASQRKHLSIKDVAYAGGWKDTTTLLKCYQQPDPESVEQVVLGGRELRMVR